MSDAEGFTSERELVGSLILGPERYFEVREIVGPDDLEGALDRAVFVTIGEMVTEGIGIDAATVSARMRDAGRAPAVGSAAGLVGFIHNTYTAFVPHSEHALDYAREVRRQSLRRNLRTLLTNFASEVEKENPETLATKIIDRLTEVTSIRCTHHDVKLIDAACNAIDARLDPDTAYLATGYSDLDCAIRGLGRRELVIIAGRPYVGKTTFLLNLVCRMTAVQLCRVLFVSMEMEAAALAEAALLFSTGLTSAEFAERARRDSQGLKAQARSRLGDRTVWIERRHRLSAAGVMGLIRRARARLGIDVVVIDNLHLMEDERTSRHTNRVQELAAITRALKVAASETNTTVIAISHLNRGPEHRQDARPTMGDLRDSGAIEQDADVVAFLYRADLHTTPKPGAPQPTSHPVELIVRKRRNGRACTVPFLFFPADCSFRPACTQSVDAPPAPARRRHLKEGGFSCAQE
jgi:replicative DNA helicase